MEGSSHPRMPGGFDSILLFGALGIARESVRLILKHSSFLTAIAAALIYPASAAIFLSHPILGRHLASRLVVRMQAIAHANGFPATHFTDMICLKLSQAMASYVFCFPFILTFLLLAKAAIAHTVAYAHAGYKPSGHRLFRALPHLWKRSLATYSWVCLIVLGFSAVVVFFLWVLVNLMGAMGFPSTLVIWAALPVGVLYSLIFAHAMILSNMATVVSVVEDCCGLEAILRARLAIKGMTRIALVSSLITSLSSICVEGLFEYRVMSVRPLSPALLWEGPLLIFMHSLVGLMDAVMTCVFYYTCNNISCRWAIGESLV